jgi:hypothetical protein
MTPYHQSLRAEGLPEETIDSFFQWHYANPLVWKEFERLSLELIARGITHYGAKSIMEVVRWHRAICGGADFKINNNYSAYYARIFEMKHPGHTGFFEMRRVRGLKEVA